MMNDGPIRWEAWEDVLIAVPHFVPEKNFITKYFHEVHRYGDPTEILTRQDVCIEYISSTFLNGWINYVRPVSAFLITRYVAHSKNVDAVSRFREGKHHHTRLGDSFDDDVLILAKETDRGKEERPYCWWYFWFDQDVSDCCIGRFTTLEEREQVISDFEEWCQQRSQSLSHEYVGGGDDEGTTENKGGKPAIEIPVEKLTGWISF